MTDERNNQTQSLMHQTDAIFTILSNENVDSTIKYARTKVQSQDDDQISTKSETPNDFSFDFKRLKFNNQPVFLIYVTVICVMLSQEILSSSSFLELQLKKITGHSATTQSTNEYLSYMKWSGIVFTVLQLFSVYFFGSILNKHGVRFSAFLFLFFYLVSNVVNLFLMSDYYTFDFYSYTFFRLIANIDGGLDVMVTIINAGIADLFESHPKRMLYFNYLYSIISVVTFLVPFVTTFVIKKFGNYYTLKVQTVITFFNIAFVHLLLNNKLKSRVETTDDDSINKNQVKITKKKINTFSSTKSKTEAITKNNVFTNIIKQFEVFILPKNTGIARRNVMLLELFNIFSTINQASISVGVSYLLVAYDFNAIQLNYLTSFFGCYGSLTSFLGIKIFYYIVNKFTSLKASSHFFDRIDRIQLLMNAGASTIGYLFPLIIRHSWLGQIFMMLCFDSVMFVAPVLNNSIIKIIENEKEYVKLQADEENDALLSVDDENELEEDGENQEHEEVSPPKSKTAIIFSCFTIQNKITTALFSAVLFQVLEMTKDTRPWLFYVISLILSSINFFIASLVKPVN